MFFHSLDCNYEAKPASAGKDLRLSWSYDISYKRNITQKSIEIEVSENPEMTDCIFLSGELYGDGMQYQLSDYFEAEERTRYYWRIKALMSDGETIVSTPAIIETGLFSRTSWEKAGAHWLNPVAKDGKMPVVPEYSRDFAVSEGKTADWAKVYVFSNGFSDLKVNGYHSDGRMLAHVNSVYAKNSYYETYDISFCLKKGENVLSLCCGSGYNADFSKYGNRFLGTKGFIAIIDIHFTDGERILIPSDTDWGCRDSNITRASIYGGETFDASVAEFEEYGLVRNDENAPYCPEGELLPRNIPELEIIRVDFPVKSYHTDIPQRQADPDFGIVAEDAIPGELFDFGEVSAGVVRITVRAPKGTQIRIFHTEMVFPDGRPDRYTNRLARARDFYICKGDGEETFMPRFTYHSFRYAHISGIDPAQIVRIEKCVISAGLDTTGHFECGSPALNRIHGLMLCGMRNNLFSYPSDCPVRDERTPCAMDSQAIEESVMYNFNASAYYSKWQKDILTGNVKQGNPDWGGDFISLMYRIRRFYGDPRPAQKHFAEGLEFFRSLMERSENGLWEKGYGDWCAPNENTWESFYSSVTAVNTALSYALGRQLIELGCETGVPDGDLAELQAGCDRIKKAFTELCVKEDNTVCGGRQTEYSMPLYAGLCDGEKYDAILAKLLERLEESGKTDIGIYGSMSLFDVLCDAEKPELAMELLENPEYPGFSYLLAKGATSLWEQWRYKGRMDSHSHGMFAGADAAFYRMFAGLSPLKPGFTEILVKPQVPVKMNYASASIDTVSGPVKIRTEYVAGGYEIKLSIPAGIKAHMIFPPVPDENTVYSFFDGETPLDFVPETDLGSGIYDFRLVPTEILKDY